MKIDFKKAIKHPLWRELVTLEYVLSQGYSQDVCKDVIRINQLREIIYK